MRTTTAVGFVARLVIAVAALGVVVPFAARAAVSPINGNPAIQGYDAVAYFTLGDAVKGQPQFKVEWNGATWLFASAEHRDAFKAAPGKYAPQYGGYCSYAVSRGYTADIDPQAFTIVNGKLYLNYSLSVRERWETERDSNIVKADGNWPKLIR